MNITASLGFYLLLVANAVLLAAACITITRFMSECRRLEQFWNSPTGVSLANREPVQEQPRPQANRHLERRVTELQSVVKTLARREQPAVKPVDGSLPIENAVRMARHGASIDELVRSCGLNIGEARLMQKLHSRVQANQAIN